MRLTMAKDTFTTRMNGDAKSPKPRLKLTLSLKNSTIKSNQGDTVTTTAFPSTLQNWGFAIPDNAGRLSQVEEPEPIL